MMPVIKGCYRRWPIPAWYPPEGVVAVGHLLAIVAAFGFAFSTTYWWGGLLVAMGVAGNHCADVLDGTHARATGQCRNGGELLDHFTDPLSYAYWVTGLAVSCQRLDLGIAGVICLYATAVLTSIKAKMIGEFTLSIFGPTEFKTLLVLYGLALSAVVYADVRQPPPTQIALGFIWVLLVIGIVQLVANLVRAVIDVNRADSAPDTSEWLMKSGRADENASDT